MNAAAHLPRRAPLYGLVIALLPACAVFGEFAPRWHPFAQLGFIYLLGAVAFYCVREMRAALRSGGREGGDSPGNAADLLLLALFMLLLFALHPLLTRLLALVLDRGFGLPWDSTGDLLHYGLSLTLWLALFITARRIPGARYDFNLRWRWKPMDLLILLGVGGVTWAVLGLYLRELGGAHPDMRIFGVSGDSVSPVAYYAIGGVFALANALSEELWFRGVLLEALRPILPAAAVILLQGLVFGISHWFGTPQGVFGLVLAGAWGCLLGWWTYARRSLWQALAVHLLADWLIFAYTN